MLSKFNSAAILSSRNVDYCSGEYFSSDKLYCVHSLIAQLWLTGMTKYRLISHACAKVVKPLPCRFVHEKINSSNFVIQVDWFIYKLQCSFHSINLAAIKRPAKTVKYILELGSTRSSGRAYTRAPILRDMEMAYLALLSIVCAWRSKDNHDNS